MNSLVAFIFLCHQLLYSALGDFIDVYGLEEGDLIVNAGECLQMMTGDLIRASPHQVGFPQPTEKGKLSLSRTQYVITYLT